MCGWEEVEVVEEWGCGQGEEEVEAYMHLEWKWNEIGMNTGIVIVVN